MTASARSLCDSFLLRGQSFRGDERGSALIEAAILTPMLIALLAGVFEFSWYFYQRHLVAIGLHDAVGYLARSSDPCNPTSRAWKTEQERAKNLATSGTIDGGPPRARGWVPTMVKFQCTKLDNPIEKNGLSRHRGSSVYTVAATTEFPCPSLGFFGVLGLRSPVISVSYSERAIEQR
jgi:TadE-like protein